MESSRPSHPHLSSSSRPRKEKQKRDAPTQNRFRVVSNPRVVRARVGEASGRELEQDWDHRSETEEAEDGDEDEESGLGSADKDEEPDLGSADEDEESGLGSADEEHSEDGTAGIDWEPLPISRPPYNKTGTKVHFPFLKSTISEDRTAGSDFGKKQLAVLRNTRQPVNDSQGESNEQNIEDRTAGSDFGKKQLVELRNTRQPVNDSQEESTLYHGADYQMQIMLLEQQNKKRLMEVLTGREMPPQHFLKDIQVSMQDPNEIVLVGPQMGQPIPAPLLPPLPPGAHGHGPLPPLRLSSRHSRPVPLEEAHHSQNEGNGILPISHSDGEENLSMVLCQYEKLHKRNQVLEQENILLRRVVDPESFQGGPPFYQVLYRFKGSDKVFFRPPTWAREDSNGQTRYILKGDSLSMKESEYLNKSKSLAFAIYKTYTLESLDGPPQGQGPDVESWPLPNHESETLSFTSKQMVEAVRKYLGKLPDHAKLVQILDMKEIPAPYLFWYHIRSSYQSTLNDLPKHQRYCTDLLAEWMTDNYEAEYKLVDEQISRGVVTCASMIYLMRPGEILVAQKDDHLESHMCTSWAVETTPPKKDPGSDGSVDSRRVWEVRGWSYEFDGSFYRKEVNLQVDMDVQDPTEEVELQKLNVIPLRCADPEVRKRLERRGKTYWECREKKFVSCSGSHSFESLNNSNERFMIDSPTYQLLHQDDQKRMIRETRRRTGILPPLVEFDDLPPAPDLYLFPSTIVGYNLRTKKWGDLEVDMIHKVDWNKSAFDNLVVDEETKELIRALITNRLEVEKGTDMIDDKGNGLIILLHGGPGTGKTFTAESVAELAEKPLYRVTCGDIGTKPEEVEQYLESALHLGKIWDCVVLLDEADVFLQERTLSDLKRNALVTVFLRVLEYYNGIMILTSNRVGTFDEAFKSRIQLALHYPNLTRSQRYKIWRNFISRLKKLDQPNINFDDIECYLGELADMDMNGRQIRNAITTARQLAKYRGRRMTHADLKHVINVAGRFDTYLSGLNEGLTDDAIARESGLR